MMVGGSTPIHNESDLHTDELSTLTNTLGLVDCRGYCTQTRCWASRSIHESPDTVAGLRYPAVGWLAHQRACGASPAVLACASTNTRQVEFHFWSLSSPWPFPLQFPLSPPLPFLHRWRPVAWAWSQSHQRLSFSRGCHLLPGCIGVQLSNIVQWVSTRSLALLPNADPLGAAKQTAFMCDRVSERCRKRAVG